jgi:hypothetical protein
MVTRLKEATIDVGPQPVRTAKFTRITWSSVVKIILSQDPENTNNHFKMGMSNSLVSCLILSTDIAFEIWLVKPNNHIMGGPPPQGGSSIQSGGANVDLECIFRRKEDRIEIIDFIHLRESNIRQNQNARSDEFEASS